MSVITNPQKYEDKMPTNVRLDKEVKEALKTEAEEKNIDMAEIVNEALKKRYKLK